MKTRFVLGEAMSGLSKNITMTVAMIITTAISLALLASGLLKAPMLKALPATFSWPQLLTALIGGAAALLIAPLLRKALRK